MKISKGEEDRVICVGEYENETDNERWIVELKRAIEKYCNSIETARKNCTQYIYEIIEDELRPELSAIKDALEVIQVICLKAISKILHILKRLIKWLRIVERK